MSKTMPSIILTIALLIGLFSRTEYAIAAHAVTGQYPLRYESNGGAGTMDPIEVSIGDTFVFPECEFEAPANKTFLNWQITGVDGIHYPGDSVVIAANCVSGGAITVTAYWTNAPAAGVTTRPEEKKLTYSGSAQELITSGSTSEGTLQYAITDTNTAPTYDKFSAEIPKRTEVGVYYVWYRVRGDATHSNSNPVSIKTEITKKSIAGATVTLNAATLEYTGSEQNVKVEKVMLGGTVLPENCYDITGDLTAKEPGTYKVTVTGKGNYKDSATAEWIIKKSSEEKTPDAKSRFLSSVKVKQKKGKLIVSWSKGTASKFDVYAAYCGTDFSQRNMKTTGRTTATFKKLNGKPINFKKSFKIYVVGYDSNGQKLGRTITAHVSGKDNKEFANVKSIHLSKKSVSVEVGKTTKVKASVKLDDNSKKMKEHAPMFRYKSSDENVAAVDENGNITGVGAGTCDIYYYAVNGISKTLKVTVQ
ncbi:Ig-like domain-containing protein [Butyrivibrio sp. AD3002]|uniref:Ig-like domain-containing protein n=1 Tax=Butyrivibrio sp. AD3002 TaxID=1280670 RepID=UPI0003B64473|nr:Ig-like domain-containing protein [Butyrivibrio sp. AD3002]